MSALPQSRGAVSEALFAALREPPHRLDRRLDDVESEDLQLALYCCYELHYRGFDGVDDGWEWEPSLLALRARARAPLRGRAARARRRARRAAGAGRDRRRAARADARRRRAGGVDLHRARGDRGAGGGVHDPPLGVPAQGGRPALVGAAAAVGTAEGGDGRDPGRRVRRRAAPTRSTPSCSRARWTPSGLDSDIRRVSGPDPGRHAGDRQPDVAARPAPAAGAARSSATWRCSR